MLCVGVFFCDGGERYWARGHPPTQPEGEASLSYGVVTEIASHFGSSSWWIGRGLAEKGLSEFKRLANLKFPVILESDS